MLRIFIGWDSRFPEPADVLRYSLIKHSSIPLEIRYLKLDELKLNRAHDPLASTEFTYSRFLVPYLCNYRGKAVFMDNDMLALGDVKQLDELDMSHYALRVVKHDYQPENAVKMYGCPQTSYPRKNWSSLMIMDCAAPALDEASRRDANRRLSAPLPGYRRRHDRRDPQDLEFARPAGRQHRADSLHQRRSLVRTVRQPCARRGLAQMRDEMERANRTAIRMPHLSSGPFSSCAAIFRPLESCVRSSRSLSTCRRRLRSPIRCVSLRQSAIGVASYKYRQIEWTCNSRH